MVPPSSRATESSSKRTTSNSSPRRRRTTSSIQRGDNPLSISSVAAEVLQQLVSLYQNWPPPRLPRHCSRPGWPSMWWRKTSTAAKERRLRWKRSQSARVLHSCPPPEISSIPERIRGNMLCASPSNAPRGKTPNESEMSKTRSTVRGLRIRYARNFPLPTRRGGCRGVRSRARSPRERH